MVTTLPGIQKVAMVTTTLPEWYTEDCHGEVSYSQIEEIFPDLVLESAAGEHEDDEEVPSESEEGGDTEQADQYNL